MNKVKFIVPVYVDVEVEYSYDEQKESAIKEAIIGVKKELSNIPPVLGRWQGLTVFKMNNYRYATQEIPIMIINNDTNFVP